MRLIRLSYLLLVLWLLPLSAGAESLSSVGTQLSNINIYPDDSLIKISKTIDVTDLNVQQTHIVLRLNDGSFLQKTTDNYAVFSSGTPADLGLTATDNAITFDVAEGTFFNALDYPITIYLGVTDSEGQLHFGFFNLTTELETLNSWSETAVRKVLHAFAYGGFASDTQIQQWADMAPSAAIQQMLTANVQNERLSPSVSDDASNVGEGTLKSMSTLWSDKENSDNPIDSQTQTAYSLDKRDGAETTWRQLTNLRGFNPVRQRLGLWETNYHLSVNLDAAVGINNYQMARYYDDIMDLLAADATYQDVIANAATSAAVAVQFNHRRNVFNNETQTFSGNEDFAREYHQIFFGILGYYDFDYHEEVAIKNTAKALTDMTIQPSGEGHLDEVLTFGTEQHHSAALDILNQTIEGETALEKIQALSQHAIEHPESLANLPIIIVRGLADDHLDTAKTKVIQCSWRAMAPKNLLTFLRQYAISTLFHNESRFKYHASIDRYMLVLNQLTLNNAESYRDLYQIDGYQDEGSAVFRPLHDVFGGQTGEEASDDAEIFRAVYNRSVQNGAINRQSSLEENSQTVWTKDWGSVIPTDSNGQYLVKDVVAWLWQRFIADGGKNLGNVEKLHLYALLATGTDAGYTLDPDNAERVFTSSDVDNDATVKTALQTWGDTAMDLGGDDSDARRTANTRIGDAINFLNAIPFIFGQEGA